MLAATAVFAVATIAFGPRADALSREVDEIAAVLRAPAGESRKAMEVEKLRRIDNAAARRTLRELSESPDERLAVLALRALARCEWSGAKAKIAEVFEDEARGGFVRAAALGAFCARHKADGGAWSQAERWITEHVGADDRLAAQSAAIAIELWPTEGNHE